MRKVIDPIKRGYGINPFCRDRLDRLEAGGYVAIGHYAPHRFQVDSGCECLAPWFKPGARLSWTNFELEAWMKHHTPFRTAIKVDGGYTHIRADQMMDEGWTPRGQWTDHGFHDDSRPDGQETSMVFFKDEIDAVEFLLRY